MSAPVIEPAQWRASDRTERVNYLDAATGAGATRSVRVAHLVRGDHTLCGRNAAAFTWHETDDGFRRCPGCAAVGPSRFIHRDLRAAAGISYRQFDLWCREGHLRADNPDPGTGAQRTFCLGEVEVAHVMGALVAAGVRPSTAAQAARTGYLAPGIRVVVEAGALT